jgi:GNAT superfamily N-acetyltransferase
MNRTVSHKRYIGADGRRAGTVPAMDRDSPDADAAVRVATVADAEVVARLLHDFNTEFDTPSPGVDVLADRLRSLLAGPDTVALLAGEPAEGLALVTFRPNVWYPGPVALLDELYVVPHRRGQGIGTAVIQRLVVLAREREVCLIEINVDEADVDAQRFYERHGFSLADPDTGERAYYVSRELES